MEIFLQSMISTLAAPHEQVTRTMRFEDETNQRNADWMPITALRYSITQLARRKGLDGRCNKTDSDHNEISQEFEDMDFPVHSD